MRCCWRLVVGRGPGRCSGWWPTETGNASRLLYLLASDMPVLADRSLDHTAFLEKIEISARGH